MVGGDVVITGRIKDIIIRAGRNVYPHELEEAVGGTEGVRKGCVAVFASQDAHTRADRLIVLAETRVTDPDDLDRIRKQISETSTALLGLPPDEVVLVPPHTVPKTSSGKLRRSAARALYESGALARRSRALWWQLTRLSLLGTAHRLRRKGRLAAEYGYAAWWWTLLGVIAVPIWVCAMILPRRHWRHAALGFGCRLFLRLAGLPVTVEREADIPARSVMIVANHASYLDGAILSTIIPGELSFISKEEFARQLIAGSFLRRIGSIFVRRVDPRGGLEDTERWLAAAQAGERIVSFPEGTFTRMPGLLPFRLGTFVVAAKAGVPVVPITIRGARSILRGGQWLPRRGPIHVHIGSAHRADGDDFDAAVRLRDAVRAAILARCGEPDLARERIKFT
jgi:1-acyl-sn-glycerol-3-phosphate acyltransferase